MEQKQAELWWLNEESHKILNRGYLLEGETVDSAIDRICRAAASYYQPGTLGYINLCDNFRDIIEKGWMSLSSPIWANMGTERGLPISCFNVHISDSMDSISSKLREVIMQTKIGGGTSGYFGDIRGRGAEIKNNGKSSGSVTFMRLFDTAMDTISQGGVRRGAFAAYLDIDHPDVEEYLTIKDIGSPIQNLFYAVCVPDYWMQDMVDGDIAKRNIWAKVLASRQQKGLPYIFFSDNVNKNKPQIYKDLDMKINASNLCMIGSDRIVSDRGYLTAKELEEQGGELILFDGQKAIKSSAVKLRERNVDVYKITLANGLSHTVTEYHGIPVVNEKGVMERKECRELKVGDKVPIQTQKGLFGTKRMVDEAYLLGLYQSDGTQWKENIYIDVWEKDFDLIPEIEKAFERLHYKYGWDTYDVSSQGVQKTRNKEVSKFRDCFVNEIKSCTNVKKKRLQSRGLKKIGFEKGYVPTWIWESDEETQWAYIKGLLQADGSATMSNSQGQPIQVAYTDVSIEFIQELQLLFNNLGLQSTIWSDHNTKRGYLPNGKGGYDWYDTKVIHRLIVGSKNNALEIEKHTKFLTRKNLFLDKESYRDNSKKSYEIVSIEYVGKEDVYCPTVYTNEHLFVANGMLTFNCSEIALPSTDDESFICCLSSMNLELYDEWKDTDAVKIAVLFLDAVLQEFINKTEDLDALKHTNNFAKRHRALGLGVLGWHSLLQKNMLSFDSMEAKRLNAQVFRKIQEKAVEASQELGAELGYAPIFNETKNTDYWRRNTTLLAIAPTTSSSAILGQTSPGIEPYSSNYYKAGLAKGNFMRKNKYLQKLLEEKGLDNEDIWRSIMLSQGSVQHLEGLTVQEKNVFKTFKEISPIEIVTQAAQRQQWIDQSQSLNLNIPSDVPIKEVNQLMIEAWRLGIKTLYYQRSQSISKEIVLNMVTCSSCEA